MENQKGKKSYEKPAIIKTLEMRIEMTDTEKEEQRLSFAYGNASFENPDITREIVYEASRKLKDGEYKLCQH